MGGASGCEGYAPEPTASDAPITKMRLWISLKQWESEYVMRMCNVPGSLDSTPLCPTGGAPGYESYTRQPIQVELLLQMCNYGYPISNLNQNM